MNNINKIVFVYLAVVVFILWVCSVIESFIPCSWKWFLAAMQIFFIIKVTFGISILFLALIIILRYKSLICEEAEE